MSIVVPPLAGGGEVANGPVAAQAQHLPRDEAWLVAERPAGDKRKYHLTNHPADTPLDSLAARVKTCQVCEPMHQQLKDELGLDHVEGLGWSGLHHHALLCQLAFAFLQHRRLGGKSIPGKTEAGPPPPPSPPAIRRHILAAAHPHPALLPAL
jgi:SRSO17 transposase